VLRPLVDHHDGADQADVILSVYPRQVKVLQVLQPAPDGQVWWP
jgi:hypothetical protein